MKTRTKEANQMDTVYVLDRLIEKVTEMDKQMKKQMEVLAELCRQFKERRDATV